MPGGGYTGDGSVKWFVEVDSARDGETRTSPRPGFDRGLKHEGVEDLTPRWQDFTIEIEIPSDSLTNQDPNRQGLRKRFIDQLRTAIENVEDPSKTRVTLKIPIQDGNSGYTPSAEPQIRVTWPTPTSPI